MKRVFYFIVFLFLLIGCSQTDDPKQSDIYLNIELESGFQNDSVIVSLDDNILLEARITTDFSINVAWASGFKKLSKDDHTIQLDIVEFGIYRDFDVITLGDTTTVLFSFDRDNEQVIMNYVKGAVLRD